LFKIIECFFSKKAKKIIAVDACMLACVKAGLGKHGLSPDVYYQLSAMGVKRMIIKISIQTSK